AYVRQGHVDDRGVDRRHERAEADRGCDDPLVDRRGLGRPVDCGQGRGGHVGAPWFADSFNESGFTKRTDLIQWPLREQAVTLAKAKKGPAPRRREEARALFRNAILEAAEEVFAERGFHGARIQDIAARARLAVGTVYNHFGQKEDVLRALLEEHI